MCSERGKFGPLGGSQQGRHGDGAHSGVRFFLRARALVLARVLGWMDWRQRVLAEKKLLDMAQSSLLITVLLLD